MKWHHGNEVEFEKMQERLKQHLLNKTDGAGIQGMELSSLIRMIGNYYSAVIHQKKIIGELSGPRMGILLRLLVEEETGNKDGINPTALSLFQNVKKNTMSSLIRGLEDSGYVERTLDPNDKRVFLIRISETGKNMLDTIWPQRLKLMNDLTSDMSSEEMDQLIFLLQKLQRSMRNHVDFPIHPGPEHTGDSELDE
jgi:DNA-binding MarR family transcriptional regulator